jgi:hypothetical protein
MNRSKQGAGMAIKTFIGLLVSLTAALGRTIGRGLTPITIGLMGRGHCRLRYGGKRKLFRVARLLTKALSLSHEKEHSNSEKFS